MADPQGHENKSGNNTPLSADERFAQLVSQSKGLRAEVTGESLVAQAVKLKSIRRRFLTNVLPIMLLPLLLLGFLAVAGLSVLGQRTNDAVDSTDEILLEHNEAVAEELATVAADASEAVDNFLVDWNNRVERLDSADDPVNGVNAMAIGQSNVQVLFVTAAGDVLYTTHEDETQDSYAGEEWLDLAQQNNQFRSFVDDGEHVPSFEFIRALSDGNFARVRVPFTNLHAVTERIARRFDSDVAVADRTLNIVLADTLVDHNPDVLYQDAMALGESSVDLTAMDVDFESNEETGRVSATSSVLLDSDASEFPFPEVDWTVLASEEFDSITVSLLGFSEVSEDVNQQQRVLSLGIGLILFVSAIAAFFALRFAARQISQPVEQLSDQAQRAADVGIPAVVEAARTSDELPELDEFSVDTDDELSILAASLNTMQDAAVELAAGQAQLRRQNVSRTFVSLGRRNQNLLNRQLEFIEELEQQERDADALENLFRLDHLATRMRRNAENLLVLAGEQTPRRWGKPIAVRDVLRAAASEIADYRRVRLGDVDDATVSGNLATDLSHLFAELLENAGSFSPPTTPIEVFGQQTDTHYRLAIVDQGIGMDEQSLAQVNDRLQNPVDFADAPSAYLGLFVVGRLAQEMGVTVRLAGADPTGEGHRRGTIAFIDLPNALLSSDIASEVQTDEKASGAVVRRTDELDAAQEQAETTGAAVFAEGDAAAANADAEEPAPAVVAEADDAEVDEATDAPAPVTSAGFPKRAKGSTSVKTTPDKFVSDTPPVADPTPTPEASPAATEAPTPVTSAGFPKRARGATSIKTTPDKFVSDTPAAAGEVPAEKAPIKRDPKKSSVALVNAAKAEAKKKAAEEAAAGSTPQPEPAHQPEPAPQPHATVPPAAATAPAPAPTGETTAAGFPKRGEKRSASSIPEPAVDRTAAPTRTRDAAEVKNSLLSYRAAVARGRSNGQTAEMPVAVVATPSGEDSNDQDSNTQDTENARPGSA